MVEKSQDIEMDKSVAVGNVENNSENTFFPNESVYYTLIIFSPAYKSNPKKHLKW